MQLSSVQSLDVSKNRVTSLKCLSSLPGMHAVCHVGDVLETNSQHAGGAMHAGLQVLKASHNKILQVAPLAACPSLRVKPQRLYMHTTTKFLFVPAVCLLPPSLPFPVCLACYLTCRSCCLLLQELWLQSNQVADYAQLQSLRDLPLLATLFLTQNPVCTALKQDYRPAVVAAVPSLQVQATRLINLMALCCILRQQQASCISVEACTALTLAICAFASSEVRKKPASGTDIAVSPAWAITR